jgi:hypothetical protein
MRDGIGDRTAGLAHARSDLVEQGMGGLGFTVFHLPGAGFHIGVGFRYRCTVFAVFTGVEEFRAHTTELNSTRFAGCCGRGIRVILTSQLGSPYLVERHADKLFFEFNYKKLWLEIFLHLPGLGKG